MEVSGTLHTPSALSSEKGHWCPLNRRLGGPQRWSGRGGEEKNSHPLQGLEPPIIQSVSRLTPSSIFFKIYQNQYYYVISFTLQLTLSLRNDPHAPYPLDSEEKVHSFSWKLYSVRPALSVYCVTLHSRQQQKKCPGVYFTCHDFVQVAHVLDGVVWHIATVFL